MFAAGDTETVTRIRPAGRDLMGDPLPGTAELDIDGCLVAPGASSESSPGENAQQTTAQVVVYAPPGTDILSIDQLRIRGQVHDVTGVPQAWGNAGLVVEARRTTG